MTETSCDINTCVKKANKLVLDVAPKLEIVKKPMTEALLDTNLLGQYSALVDKGCSLGDKQACFLQQSKDFHLALLESNAQKIAEKKRALLSLCKEGIFISCDLFFNFIYSYYVDSEQKEQIWEKWKGDCKEGKIVQDFCLQMAVFKSKQIVGPSKESCKGWFLYDSACINHLLTEQKQRDEEFASYLYGACLKQKSQQ